MPICSIYGTFTYIWVIFRVNVGTYSSTMEHLGCVEHSFRRQLGGNLELVLSTSEVVVGRSCTVTRLMNLPWLGMIYRTRLRWFWGMFFCWVYTFTILVTKTQYLRCAWALSCDHHLVIDDYWVTTGGDSGGPVLWKIGLCLRAGRMSSDFFVTCFTSKATTHSPRSPVRSCCCIFFDELLFLNICFCMFIDVGLSDHLKPW